MSPSPPPSPSLIPPAQPWWSDSFMVTFAFHCNIACTFCMVEDVLNVFPGTSLASFERFLEKSRDAGGKSPLTGVKRIIFSGGEVTLSKQLPDYARLARRIPGVEHVRIQTNATRLADPKLLASLIEAGIDEYFVSMHAPDQPLYEAIAQRATAFDQILDGVRAIHAAGATLITNTAVVAQNHTRLREIVERMLPFSPRSMEFWNYWPRADEDHAVQHVARIDAVRPYLIEALAACVAAGIAPVVKWFPRCLLGEYARYQDDGQPPAIIEDGYWERRPGYACIYEGLCQDAASVSGEGGGRCSGLSTAYISRFGWEQELLQPRRLATGGPSGSQPPAGDALDQEVRRSLVEENGPPSRDRAGDEEVLGSWLAGFGLRTGELIAGWTLASTMRAKDGGMVGLTFRRGERAFELRIQPRDPARKCYGRSASFDFLYARYDGDAGELAATIREVVVRIGARDPGGLSLPG